MYVHSCRILFDHVQFPLITGPVFQVPMQYCSLRHWILTFTTRHIHKWVSFLLWPNYFILSGTICNCAPLFHSSILDIFWPGGFIFWYHIFWPFCTVPEVFMARMLEWFAFASPVTMFCQNSSLWPVHLWGPCMAWIIDSLSYTSPFTTTCGVIHEG